MPLTKVSFSVIQVANNVTSTTVGNTTSIPSFTFDQNGVITSASNVTPSIANTQITGTITAGQLATSLNLATNNVQVASIQSATGTPGITFAANGQMTLANTPLILTGGGITFPATQVPSADANTLDDYEEGTWTATLIGQTTAPTTPVTVTGKYVKIGKQLTAICGFNNVDTTGASGALIVNGLPFAADGGVPQTGCPPMLYSLPCSGNYNVWYIVGSALNLYHIANAAGWNQENISAGTGKYVWATVTYITA
jgi:hypothetical protein